MKHKPVKPDQSSFIVFITFLQLGFTSFGGPVAHLGYFQTVFVQQKRWISAEAYAELVALCQFIPGPASSQVGFGIGLQRAGIAGAVAAWLGFTLPSALLMLLLGVTLVNLELSAYQGLLQGLKITAVAVVCWALWSMAKSLTPDYQRRSIALVAAGIALLLPGIFGQLGGLLLGALLAPWLVKTTRLTSDQAGLQVPISTRLALTAAMLFSTTLLLLPLLAIYTQNSSVLISDAMYRAGALVFGGGHVVLPLLHAETVNTGLISADDFLAGYGVAQAMPGPLFSFAAFIGAHSGGVLMALVALVAIFLPGCLLLIAILPIWQKLRQHHWLRQVLGGINAAVVGLLAAALYDPVITAGIRQWQDALLALVLLGLLATGRVPVWLLVPLGALAGYSLL
ncbi:hypothetical protein LH51_01385 [Nitrincola sp. A-D6]|uniref:chromate efflux transporter n=1 Tax=Nitrincola sp. A-D6 TaxID=1545442 RepID=UPI00051FA866|nr:chromate efflux transporter [Nitrincola sp. A-D6]KGK43196.1 hypothetical protein LH51_01385 [Nitrincola sp. A-D6]